MPLDLLTTAKFEKDFRRVRKQGKDIDKLEKIVDLLQHNSRFRPPAGRICYTEVGQAIGTAISVDWPSSSVISWTSRGAPVRVWEARNGR